jgi:hypothetical protein
MKGLLLWGKWIICLLLVFTTGLLSAQQVATPQQAELPEFTVMDMGGGRIVVSWANKYPNMAQVAVQRSYDSLRRFSTIFSAESPGLPQNGYTDQVYGGVKVYYRIYYSLEGGAYFFTKAKRPTRDANYALSETDLRRDRVTETIKSSIGLPEKRFFVKLGDTLVATLVNGDYNRFRDSIISQTKDTLSLVGNDTILLKQYIAPVVYRTSIYVYPDKDGYIVLNLPEALTKKYDLIVKEENDEPVLEIKQVKATYLTLDKADFYHGGWYNFELWENGKLKEKNKFYLAKDF